MVPRSFHLRVVMPQTRAVLRELAAFGLPWIALLLSYRVLTLRVAERKQQLVFSASPCAQLPPGNLQYWDPLFGRGYWGV